MIIDDTTAIDELLSKTRRVAVLGIKTEAQANAPSFYVPQALLQMGFDVVPVPVYYPDVTTILGQSVYRRLADVPAPPIDMVDVFRQAEDLEPHLEDILAAKPKSVWLQLGIRDDAFAAKLSAAGITVVQDRCLMVDARRFMASRRA